MRFVAIPTEACSAVWFLVDEYMRRACDRGVGDISSETLRDECIRGDARLIAVQSGNSFCAAGVVRFCLQADQSLACDLVACGGGSLREWRHVIPDIEAWARFHGAKTIRLCGRPGWERVFRGYRRRPLISLVKDL